MKKLLILGGTQFIGRNLVERLQKEDDFELTLFNRQMTGAELFQDVQKIKGDRSTDDIQQIAGKDWDFIIDLSCYFPEDMKGGLSNYRIRSNAISLFPPVPFMIIKNTREK